METIKKYEIDYGFGRATLYTPFENWEQRFRTLAGCCFGIRKSILFVELIKSSQADEEYFSKKKERFEHERLEFNGDIYIWRKDGARKMLAPFKDKRWDKYYCGICVVPSTDQKK